MSPVRHSVSMLSLLRTLCIVVCGTSFILSEPIIADEDRYAQSHENTRAAIDELNEVLRFLFPIVPHKSHWSIWSSRHRDIVINQPRQLMLKPTPVEHNAKSFHSKSNKEDKDYEEEEEEAGNTRPKADLQSQRSAASKLAAQSAPLPPSQVLVAAKDIAPSEGANAMLPKVHLTGNSDRNQMTNKIYHLVLHAINGNANRLETGRNPSKPELTTPSLGKRGPECMRRCIMQGLLHPVQCHSLC